ncbi:choline transporter-like protein ctl1 [Echria macrotheca]|uniref:Protein PNS1 n=1 Tax=Echria macrotheca TaxID=438768 RepID=A0AAJ0BB48_9PEZI|nr:choline transporter-like protein ctl1 [Echria macrotheca]
MFSEYASRFLAQSRSRISNLGGQQDGGDRSVRQPSEWQGRGVRRTYFGRGGANNPYQTGGSRFANLGFGSRYATQDAPLFQATLEHEEDDEEERDREASDLYALQRSRRVFAASRLEESTETEHDESRASLERSHEEEETLGDRLRGIRSSWNGAGSLRRSVETGPRKDIKGKGRAYSDESDESRGLEEVGLESTIADNEPPADLTVESPLDSTPPAFQRFKSTAPPSRFFSRKDSIPESELGLPPPSSVDTNINALPASAPAADETFKHDAFFAWIHLIAQASLLSTFVLVYLHTNGKKPTGDTIYTALRASFHLLAVDTVVSIIVSLVWLAALRSFVKHLVVLVLVAVPVILFSFSLYPFISSYQSGTGSSRLQDIVMRWAAGIPAISAVIWVYLVYKGKTALKSAVDILEFSSRILAANSALVVVGMGCLAVIVLWTWIWLLMFMRVFLGGSFAGGFSRFIISASSWWLGVYFVLMYIWTISIISGVQRTTTASTVSQWYFHRKVAPAPSSAEVVTAALGHSLTTIFGTISFSTLLALGIRAPLLILPQRAANIISMFAYSFIPTPIVALTNPLTLTYSAIHSQALAPSARGLSQMDFLAPQRPTTTLTPAALPKGRNQHSPLLPYRLAKLILHATRFIMAIALGFAGWVMTARQLEGSKGVRGSAYAYVVGLVASFIGWGILGAMEGILSGIVDAVVICYGSETRMPSGGGGYCMEAAYLFGDRRAVGSREEPY